MSYFSCCSSVTFQTSLHDMNNVCECYFLGTRTIFAENEDPLWFTIIRVASFFTLFVPVIMAILFCISTCLTNSDKTNRAYWEKRVISDNSSLQDLLIDALSCSGIESTPYSHIFVVPVYKGSKNRFLSQDGSFYHYHSQITDFSKVLCLRLYTFDSFTTAEIDKQLQYLIAAKDCDTNMGVQQAGGSIDIFFLVNFSMLSNRLKEIIVKDL